MIGSVKCNRPLAGITIRSVMGQIVKRDGEQSMLASLWPFIARILNLRG